MAYTKTAWINDAPPALNATNLNHAETGIGDAHDLAAAATAARIATVTALDTRVDALEASGVGGGGQPIDFLTLTKPGPLLAVAGEARVVLRREFTIIGIGASLSVAGSTTTTVDVNQGGVTLYTTQGNRPTILAGQLVGVETVPNITTIPVGAEITVDVDTAGTGAEQLLVEIIGRWAIGPSGAAAQGLTFNLGIRV